MMTIIPRAIVFGALALPLLAASDSHSQTQASPPSPSATALVQTLGPARIMAGHLRITMIRVVSAVQRENPGKESEVSAKLPHSIFAQLQELKAYDVVAPMIAQAYERRFSDEEMRQLKAFLDTPLGQKLLQKQDEIDNDLLRIAVVMMSTREGQATIAHALQQLEQEGYKVPPIPAPKQ
jgi:hypothetical protein